MTDEYPRFLNSIFDCIRAADRDGPLPHRASDQLRGLSGGKTVGALQRLAGLFAGTGDAVYLEIGVFQGLTLLSVAVTVPEIPCLGVDNFFTLDPEGKNLGILEGRMAELDARNAVLINQDFEEALHDLDRHLGGRKVGVYLVDGAHDYRSQLMSLMLAEPHLHRNAVVLIDDANYAFVRQATRDFLLTHPDYKMVFEAYSPAHPANIDPEARKRWESGWLNGINILARDVAGSIPDMVPPTESDRALYVNDWLVHRHQFAELAPEAVSLAQAVCDADSESESRRREALLKRFEELRGELSQRFPDRNTYSAGLTEGRYNVAPS